MYRRFVKPFFDFSLALILLCILFPLLLFLAFLLLIQNRGTPFFSQIRPGYQTRLFTIYKLKTMRDTRNEKGELLPDNKRMTPLGKIIRKLSLDELPQLWNVLKGEMSFVGPRPLLPEYVPLYSKEQLKRHEVKPGITGWAQINGFRGETRRVSDMVSRVEHDRHYVKNWSIFMDIKILVLTVFKGWTHENAY